MEQFIKNVLILCVCYCRYVTAEGNFFITGSKIIRENSSYEIAVTTSGYDICCPKLQLSIKAGVDNEKKYEETKIVDLQNDSATNVTFNLNMPKGLTTYLLEAKTVTEPYLQRSVLLHKSEKYFSVLIQTDKSTYKPSDLVQFRVLVLDQDTKPFNASKIDIFITDAEKNRLKQFLNVSLKNGVYKNEFQLFDSAVLGEWFITVKVNDGKNEEKSFKVAKYVLPKFDVSIVTDPYLTTKDDTLKVTVNAKYTHGRSVKGSAVVTVSFYSQEKSTKNVKVNGKGTIEFDIRKDLKLNPEDSYYDVDLKIDAKFTEELTGNERTAISSIKIVVNRNSVEVVVENQGNLFKPGLPFRFHIVGKTNDEKPISDEFNKVKVVITQWNNPIEQYCNSNKSADTTTHNLTLKNGIAPLEIVPIMDNVHIRAEYLKISSEREVNVMKSSSGKFIQIYSNSKKSSLNDSFTVHVESTEEMNELIYQITNRGKIIETKVLKFPSTNKTKFEIDVNFAMIPQCNIVAFYFGPNGEVISDEVTLSFSDALPNYIHFELSKYEVKPDTELDITVKTSSLSFVALLGIDQSSLLLGSNDLKPSQIFDQLKEYNLIDQYSNDNYDILSLSDDDYANIEDENLMDKIEFEGSKSFIITNRIFVPSESKDVTKSKGDDGEKSNEQCRHRNLPNVNSKVACCPLTKEEIEIEQLHRPYVLNDEITDRFGSYFQQSEPTAGLQVESIASLSDVIDIRESISLTSTTTSSWVFASIASPEEADLQYSMEESVQSAPKFEIRKSFPETWFFEDTQLEEHDNGTKTLHKTVPSEITSWIITGFSLNPSIGLGMTMQPTKLKVFQPFFVSVNLPYSIKRGEIVAIAATVFNFQDFELPVQTTLYNDHNEFEFIDIDEDENNINGKASTNMNRTKRAIVPSDDGVSISFMIRPIKVGHITVKIVATSPVAGDGLERMLLVEPEGVTKYVNKVILIDLKDSHEMSTRTSITIPSNSVPDSTKIEIGIVGDVMGPTIENLQKLIKLPYGCGEQNMLNFVPNIVVLNYLATVNKLTPEIKRQLIKYLETGYRRELQFRHENGSYSAFGRSDPSGSTWLTAFVVKSFGRASKFITVDDEFIKKGLEFLKSVQQDDGHFPEVGNIIHKAMQGGSSNGIGLTSYALMSFLESDKYLNEYKNTAEKALKYITENLNTINDTYSLSIVAYTLQLADHPQKSEILEKLKSKANQTNGEMFWSIEAATKPSTHGSLDFYQEEPKTLDVEMTAYALGSFILAGKIQEAVPIMKWMLKQRNENGGFQSTQDTVVGLQSLASLAENVYSADSSFDISVKTDQDVEEKTFQVNAENALLLQREEVDPTTNEFEISAIGHGFGLLQISYQYNVNETDEQPKFLLRPEIQDTSELDTLKLKICVHYVPSQNDISKESNMAVMEIALPSGYTLDPENISSLEQSIGVKKVEQKKKETIAIVYFNSVDESGYCLEVLALRTTKIANQKPAFVVVYDYYDNSYRVTEFYEPPRKTLCEICEGEDCKASCGKSSTRSD